MSTSLITCPKILKIARAGQTVLITGRTGTGKSHLAKEMHEAHAHASGRTGKFVAINLATLSENLIESELFGHEKGAFSGAFSKRMGKLETANGGTAFLDEIGELPLHLQTKLLEALNSRVISPVGSNREVELNVRVIAATNRDLSDLVKRGQFREDLFYRLNVFHLELKGLISDPQRIPTLARAFAFEAGKRQGKKILGLSPEFVSALRKHRWPGNIRELKNCIDYAVAMTEDGMLRENSLPPSIGSIDLPAPESVLPCFPTNYREARECFEKVYLREVLRRFEGKINQTAKESGLSKVTLIEKIRRLEIDVNRIKYHTYIAQETR